MSDAAPSRRTSWRFAVRRWLFCALLALCLPLVLEPVAPQTAHQVLARSRKKKRSSRKSSSKKSSSKKSSSKSSSSKKTVVITAPVTEGGAPTEIVLPAQKPEATTVRLAPSVTLPRNPKVLSRPIPDLQPLPGGPLFSTREIADYCWTPDGRRLIVVTNLSGHANLWAVDISAASWPQQLTFSDDRVESPRVSPDGRSVVYVADPGDNDRRDIFLMPMAGGTAIDLTGTPGVDERQAEWSPDGTQLAWISDEGTPGNYQVYVADVIAGKLPGAPRRVSLSVQSSMRPRWSPDGSRILVTRYRTPGDSSLVVIDLKRGQETVLTPHEGEQRWLGAAWSPDGTRVLASSDVAGTFDVAVIDVGTQVVTWVTRYVGEVFAQGWSPKEEKVAWISNNGGALQIHAGAPKEAGGRGTALRIRKGQIRDARFSPDGRYLAFWYSGPTRAQDLWIYDLSRNVARQVTFSMVSGVRSEHLVEPVQMYYAAFDGRPLSGFLYVPGNLEPEARRPAIVWVHDGPDGQQQNGFDASIQFLVSRGFVVFAPNYRGSTGLGRELEDLNNQDWGGGDVQDLVHATELLKSTPYVDPNRISVVGQGFGGYLALMALTRTPDAWSAGVSLSGFFDLPRLYRQASPAAQGALRYEMGDPEQNHILWQDRSPVHYVANIRVPVLIVQGAEDHRALEKDTAAMVEEMKTWGIDVEYRVYPGEGSRFLYRPHRVDMFRQVVDFLERRLPDPPPVPPDAPVSGDLSPAAGAAPPAEATATPAVAASEAGTASAPEAAMAPAPTAAGAPAPTAAGAAAAGATAPDLSPSAPGSAAPVQTPSTSGPTAPDPPSAAGTVEDPAASDTASASTVGGAGGASANSDVQKPPVPGATPGDGAPAPSGSVDPAAEDASRTP